LRNGPPSPALQSCRKVLDSGIVEQGWHFINITNATTVKVGDVTPYIDATSDRIQCGMEAKKHAMPGAEGVLLELQG
jgi:hypothetical protein